MPTQPHPPVEAVIFDWGGTLTPWHDIDLRQQWVEFSRGYGAMACALDDLTAKILTAEDELWRRSRTTHESGRLADLLTSVGLDPEHQATLAGLSAYETFWEPHTITDPQVEALWRGLHDRDVRVGVLSNTIWTRDYHRRVFERDGVAHLIDADVYSSEIPWAKPHPEAFLAAARAVGVEPGRCVYVGDRSFEDVHGPQQVGMRAVWVPHSRIPVEQQVSHGAEPDAVAHELVDVLAIVDGWNQHG